ncbi:Uncharacterised protein [Vibrio cholerae]|nr:Uncharacterised protein [Vibrio cholerae]CSD14226.1 Uncharacterised protein [Vibrio cholerae]
MSDHQKGGTGFAVQLTHQIVNRQRRFMVQIARRFIGQHQIRLID